MPASQFSSPAKLHADGQVFVHGTQQVEPLSSSSEVEYRFLLVQGELAIQGAGSGHGGSWTGMTGLNQPQLQPGPVLAVGLAVLARSGAIPGFTTFSWSDQIELVEQESA